MSRAFQVSAYKDGGQSLNTLNASNIDTGGDFQKERRIWGDVIGKKENGR